MRSARAGRASSNDDGMKDRFRRHALLTKSGKRSRKNRGSWLPAVLEAGRSVCGVGTKLDFFSAATAGGGWGFGPGPSVAAGIPFRGPVKICVKLQREGGCLSTP